MSMTEPAAPPPAPVRLPPDLSFGGRRGTPLLPESSIAGRALVFVIVIMAFLASMTAGTVQLIAEASAGWTGSVAREMTIQVRPRPGRDIEADVRRAYDIARRTAPASTMCGSIPGRMRKSCWNPGWAPVCRWPICRCRG
jgi:cell division transport system permease protein